MRPLELIVEGFTSFRTRQVLDFASLDLFAITGATGAGKTSLLDAITFALYNKVSQKPNSSKELVSQGAKQLKVEFRFVMRQIEYKALRTWRNRGKTDVPHFILEELIGAEWGRCNTQKVEDIIGMDFETFTRVIILPQGQFDEFLKGEASKRREILRQLAGFQIFEQMRKAASDRTSGFKAEREGLEKVLAAMQAPTNEEMIAQQTELANLETVIPTLEMQSQQSRKLLEAEERLFIQIQQHQEISEKLAKLQQNASTIASLAIQFRNGQLANSVAGNWTILQANRQRLATAIAEIANTNQNLEVAKIELEKQQLVLGEARIAIGEMQIQIESQERNLALAESLHRQQQQGEAELNRVHKNTLERSQVLEKAIKAIAQAELDWQTNTEQLQEIQTAIANSSHNPDYLANLRKVAEPLTQWQILQTNLIKQQQKVDQLQAEIQKRSQQLEKCQDLVTDADKEFQTASTALSQAESTNLQALQSSHVNALRAELHDGDNCPVCNSRYSLDGLTALIEVELIDTTTLLNQRHIAERNLVKLREDKLKIETNLETSQQQYQAQSQDLINLTAQTTELRESIDRILKTSWQSDELIRDRQTLEKQELAYQKLINEQKEITIAVQNAATKLSTNQENRQLAVMELQKAEQERSLRESQLQEISQGLEKITAGKSYETLQQQILQAKSELSDRLLTIEKSYQTARENFVKREESAAKASENHDLAMSELTQQEANWKMELGTVNFSESEFLSYQTSRSQLDSWQQQIADYQCQEQDLTTRLQIITEAIADQFTDQQAIAKLRTGLQQIEQELLLASENRASLKAWLEQAQQKRQESQELEERKNSLSSQEQIHHTLAQDLQSHKFQEYILDSLQQELANRASVLLQQLSDDRYILQIENGDYWVSDNWNGGEKRRVRTLSGGETFAASLSMALALSEKLSMGIELGSLFLDEGFGTLDSETLESVTQILESLRQGDRLIGVITHIQSLADRLPTQIHVRKSINGSELVKI